MANALAQIYPQLGLKKKDFPHQKGTNFILLEIQFNLMSLFDFVESNLDWKTPQRRREFFDKLAKQKGFDPLIADNWYSLTQQDIKKQVSFSYSLIRNIVGEEERKGGEEGRRGEEERRRGAEEQRDQRDQRGGHERRRGKARRDETRCEDRYREREEEKFLPQFKN